MKIEASIKSIHGNNDLLNQAGNRLGVDLVLLGVHGEHPPGPSGPVPEVGQELPQLHPIKDHGWGDESMVGHDGLGQSQADAGAAKDGLNL